MLKAPLGGLWRCGSASSEALSVQPRAGELPRCRSLFLAVFNIKTNHPHFCPVAPGAGRTKPTRAGSPTKSHFPRGLSCRPRPPPAQSVRKHAVMKRPAVSSAPQQPFERQKPTVATLPLRKKRLIVCKIKFRGGKKQERMRLSKHQNIFQISPNICCLFFPLNPHNHTHGFAFLPC